MKTKLVYVLTCAPEATYIEQALMAVWSARYWNPSAYIVLLTDDKTDLLLHGKRGEILQYITEKIVIPFEEYSLTPLYRSRWIKTQVRQMIEGTFLFVDCDTICCRSISEIDEFICEVGAAGDDNTLFSQNVSKEETSQKVSPLCDISKEEYYFSSGVIFCKDTPATRNFFALWHAYWKEGLAFGIKIDQPSLAKANIETGHIIVPIGNVYNNVLYTQNNHLLESAILHISNFPQTSFLFKKHVLSIIREQGITPWMEELISRIHTTYLPFDYSIKHSTVRQRMTWITEIAYAARIYGKYVNDTYEEWEFKVGIQRLLRYLLRLHFYQFAVAVWLAYKRFQLRKRDNLPSNVCAINLVIEVKE